MSYISQTQEEGVTLIAIDDNKVNAFSLDLINALNAALDEVPQDKGAVVIAGRAGVLSAGFDLNVIRAGDADEIIDLIGAGGRLLGRIFEFPRPVVVACTGHAPALAALLLLAADYRVGAEGDFVIGLNEVGANLPIPRCFLELVAHRMPASFRTISALHSHMYHPAGAEEAGFLDEVVLPEETLADALRQAKRLAKLPHPAYGITKRRERGNTVERIYQSLGVELAEDVHDMIAGELDTYRPVREKHEQAG